MADTCSLNTCSQSRSAKVWLRVHTSTFSDSVLAGDSPYMASHALPTIWDTAVLTWCVAINGAGLSEPPLSAMTTSLRWRMASRSARPVRASAAASDFSRATRALSGACCTGVALAVAVAVGVAVTVGVAVAVTVTVVVVRGATASTGAIGRESCESRDLDATSSRCAAKALRASRERSLPESLGASSTAGRGEARMARHAAQMRWRSKAAAS